MSISFDERKRIYSCLEELKKEVEDERESAFAINVNSPSLYLWIKYQKFMSSVLFENDSPVGKEIAEIIDTLKLEGFSININNSFDESKNKLLQYVKEMKDKIMYGKSINV